MTITKILQYVMVCDAEGCTEIKCIGVPVFQESHYRSIDKDHIEHHIKEELAKVYWAYSFLTDKCYCPKHPPKLTGAQM